MNHFIDDLVKTSSIPVFLYFRADWCGHCMMLAPAVKQLAEEFSGKLVVVEVDVDAEPDVVTRYQARGLPALMLFRGGKVIWSTLGETPYVQLKSDVTTALGS
jgi:thioredoxin 1